MLPLPPKPGRPPLPPRPPRSSALPKGTQPVCKVPVVCDQCGVGFEKDQHRVKARNFCSKACGGMSRRVAGAKWRDPARIKAYMADYVKANREKHNANSREWAKANREKRNANQRARRASVAEPHAMTAAEWRGLVEQFGGRCACCGSADRIEADHIVPVSLGGSGAVENIQPLCRRCNASKGAAVIDYRAKQISEAEP